MRDGLLKEVSTRTRKRVWVSLVSVLEAIGTPENAIASIIQDRLDAATQGRDTGTRQPTPMRTAQGPSQTRRQRTSARKPTAGGYSDRKVEAALIRCFGRDDPRCRHIA